MIVNNWKNDLKPLKWDSIKISVKYCFSGGTIVHTYKREQLARQWCNREGVEGDRGEPSMTQKHNVFFGTVTLSCGEIKENSMCQTEIGIPPYLALWAFSSGTWPDFGHHVFRKM